MPVLETRQEFIHKRMNEVIDAPIALPAEPMGLQCMMISKIGQFDYLLGKMKHIRFDQHVSIPFLKDGSIPPCNP
jgi:hypothetical protein